MQLRGGKLEKKILIHNFHPLEYSDFCLHVYSYIPNISTDVSFFRRFFFRGPTRNLEPNPLLNPRL